MQNHKLQVIMGGKMSTSVVKKEQALSANAIENVLVKGDLTTLGVEDRVIFYRQLCDSLQLNWMTQPFGYIVLNGKLQLYAKKDCTDQLRRRFNVSITIVSRERIGECYIVTARAKLPDGREDESTGVVALGHLKGDALANAFMKSETKAKRRVTLSILGLGMVDESEAETIRDAKIVDQDYVKPWEMTLEQRETLQMAMKTNGFKRNDLKAICARFQGGKPNSLEEYQELLLEVSQSKQQQTEEGARLFAQEVRDEVDKQSRTLYV